jgi:hypothetical protein
MSHQPEKPTTDAAENSIDSAEKATRLSKQQARFRLWQSKAYQATHSEKVGGRGQPKRRQKPSMPPLPWDQSK